MINFEILKQQRKTLKFCMGNMVFEGRKEKSEGKEKKITNDELYHKQQYVSSYKKHNESSHLMTW